MGWCSASEEEVSTNNGVPCFSAGAGFRPPTLALGIFLNVASRPTMNHD